MPWDAVRVRDAGASGTDSSGGTFTLTRLQIFRFSDV
jgi:hypothetical protein